HPSRACPKIAFALKANSPGSLGGPDATQPRREIQVRRCGGPLHGSRTGTASPRRWACAPGGDFVPQADFSERTRTMQTPSWLRPLGDCATSSRARRPRRHTPTRLALEQLEDRSVPSTLQGTVFNDLNQDGIRNPGEPGLANWFVYLDADQNGQW